MARAHTPSVCVTHSHTRTGVLWAAPPASCAVLCVLCSAPVWLCLVVLLCLMSSPPLLAPVVGGSPGLLLPRDPPPRAWSPRDKCSYLGLSHGNLRVHYKGQYGTGETGWLTGGGRFEGLRAFGGDMAMFRGVSGDLGVYRRKINRWGGGGWGPGRGGAGLP